MWQSMYGNYKSCAHLSNKQQQTSEANTPRLSSLTLCSLKSGAWSQDHLEDSDKIRAHHNTAAELNSRQTYRLNPSPASPWQKTHRQQYGEWCVTRHAPQNASSHH